MFRSLVFWLTALGVVACSEPERPPVLVDSTDAADLPPRGGGSGGSGGGGCVEDAVAPPGPDSQGFCGNTYLKATGDPPNLYFVIDRSGSMQEVVDGHHKYDSLTAAAVKLVRALGSRANVGAAVFPGPLVNPDDGCAVGGEVFPTRPGDSAEVGPCGTDGPVTTAFSRSISLPGGAIPVGGTPTGATLARLLPTLSALPGRTAVILATDGGPNCNRNATCDESRCMPNIEQHPACAPGINCCTNALFGPESCLDDMATRAAVAALAARGIKTYVVGIPGSAPYATLLNELARAGGTARSGSASYYGVDHLMELDTVLSAIGSKVILTCHVALDAAPTKPGLVNVYLDHQLVQYGAPNGWVWSGATDDAGPPVEPDDAGADAPSEGQANDASASASVDSALDEDGGSDASSGADGAAPSYRELDLLGASCATLMSGTVRQVQIVFGCPTVIPR